MYYVIGIHKISLLGVCKDYMNRNKLLFFFNSHVLEHEIQLIYFFYY